MKKILSIFLSLVLMLGVMGLPAVADTQRPSIMDGADYTNHTANAWQIVKRGYEGNTSDKKTESTDGFVRVQKNVIPTDKENEFLMYLGIDVNTQEILTEVITKAGILYTPSNNVKDYSGFYTGGDEDKANEAADNFKDVGNMRVMSTEPKGSLTEPWTVTFHMEVTPGNYVDITTTRYASSNTFNKGHYVLGIGDVDGDDICDWIEVGDAAKASGSATITVKNSVVKTLLSNLKAAAIGTVTDQMGAGITAKEIVDATNGTEVISKDGKTITWNPTVDASQESAGWVENAAELVYRFTYDPSVSTGMTDAGVAAVHLPANCPTNSSAALRYTVTSTDGTKTNPSAEFESPEIRGMLYELKLKKTDDKGEPLAGAEFTITQTGNTVNDHAQAGKKGTTATATSDENGIVDFKDLLWGTYTVTERKAPAGYIVSDDSGGQSSASGSDGQSGDVLCYTTNSGDLTAQGAGEEALKDKTSSPVVNKPIRLAIHKQDDEDSSKSLKGAKFTLKPAKGTKGTKSFEGTTDKNGNLLWSAIPAGTYTLTETEAPDGYKPAGPYTVVISEKGEVSVTKKPDDQIAVGQTTITIGTGTEKKEIQVRQLTIGDKRAGVPVKMKKVKPDAAGQGTEPQPLGGAAFTIYAANEKGDKTNTVATYIHGTSGKEEPATGTSGKKDGVFLNGELNEGIYYIHETAAPAGYYALKEDVKIRVKDGVLSVLSPKDDPKVQVSEEDKDGQTVYTLSIQDDPMVQLPSAGTKVMPPFVLCGMILTGAAAAAAFARRRRRTGGTVHEA